MNIESLCLELATSDDGDDVINILKEYKLWDTKENWHLVGAANIHDEFTNNHSTQGTKNSDISKPLELFDYS